MDFAKKLLNKYGWKEGEGLGKNNNGIAKPLKASLKFDSAGFGSDIAASDFNNHWWERVFNEAAQNVQVQSEGNGEHIKLDLKNPENEVEISTKGYSVKKLKKVNAQKDAGMIYNNFMQSATLTTRGTVIDNPFKVDEEEIAMAPFKTLTDEELFAACGGRTAHKGARHGLKLSGKLARLEKQEQEMLAKMLAEQNAKKPESIMIDKKKDKLLNEVENVEVNSEEFVQETKPTKKKKKKDKQAEIEETVEIPFKKSKKSKKKYQDIEHKEHLEEPQSKRTKLNETTERDDNSKIRRKKSKKKHTES